MTSRAARVLLITSVAGSVLTASSLSGCKRWQKSTQPQAEEASPDTQDRVASVADDTEVIDERPSARYRVLSGAESSRPRGDVTEPDERPPALTPDDLVVESPRAPEPATREGRALASARELRAMGDIQAALAELERAIAFNPRFTPALLEAGDLHMEMGEMALAERSYAAAARSEPRNFDAQFKHAEALQGLGQIDDAIRAYLRALAVRPRDFDATLGISTAHLEDGDPEQALSYAQRAVRTQPKSGAARMHLGNVFAALERDEDAVIEYRQAAELLPKPAPGLLLNMAESFNRLGRYAEMVGALDQVVDAAPTPIAYERMGSGLFRLRRYDDALDAFQRSADLDPAYSPALNGIAVCELNNYLWSGKTDGTARERAVQAMRASLRVDRSQSKIVELLRRYSDAAPQERHPDDF